jgi:RNA polymerase primary sigma factor
VTVYPSTEELLPLVQNLHQGLPALRRLLDRLDYTYANEALMRSETLVDFTETPRIVARLCDDEITVLYFPLRKITPRVVEQLCREYQKHFPYLFCWFSGDRGESWQMVCPPLSGASIIRYSVSFLRVNISSAALHTLARLSVSDSTEDIFLIYDRFLSVLHSQGKSASEATTPTKVDKIGCPTALAAWTSLFARYPIPSIEAERDLVRRIAMGDTAARKYLILSNLRLVFSIAKRYQGRGIDFEDLLQDGTIGLIQATDKYDASLGFRFSTYATHWIRQALGRAVENYGRMIRLPSHAIETLGKIKRVREFLETQLCRDPTPYEIASHLKMSKDKVEYLLKSETPEPMSLNAPAGDATTALGDLLIAEDTTVPSARVFRRALREEIARALKNLTPREREVLTLRYGLREDKEDPMTLEEVGRELHLSRERARQIEAGALQKLRRGEVGGRLRETVVSSSPDGIMPYSCFEDVPNYKTSRHLKNNTYRNLEPSLDYKIETQCNPPVHVRSCEKSTTSKTTKQSTSTLSIKNDVFLFLPNCYSCKAEVILKPTFNGQWYRCKVCGDTRAIPRPASPNPAA